ncbi:PdaC/SigV domain-containing protein [Paenibacillus sp. J22TS3]|uniref:PdaC/SigV domain-containing protein n=1 Tax=Paenibacillus sp. J22TS3 TaxID=2807192 RepID=UPI001B2B308F|nr:DUF4163 domain-containing protein [Paenibacillus sp. J22TS3]GIP24570.1 hypothetical protein J22TS3_48450 [Paenibacillus sp. J22TS3]
MNQGMKWSAGLLAAAILVGGAAVPAGTGYAAKAVVKKAETAQVPVSLKWNGKVSKDKGMLIGGRVFVPVTFLRDTVGMKFTYDAKSHVYSIGEGYRKLNLTVSAGTATADINGYYLLSDEYGSKMNKGHLYVPYKLLNDYMGLQSNWDTKTKQLSVGARAENAIQIKTVTVDKTFKGATAKLQYPQISGLADEAAQKAINDTLKAHMDKFVAAAEKELKKRTAQENKYEYDSNYIVTFNEKGVLSLVVAQGSYTGGAHGLTLTDGFTFSLKDGKQLGMSDLLKSNPNYKKQLNQELGKKLKANGGYLGGFKGLTSDKNFYLKPNTLTIYFQPYEYTAFAEGTVQYDFALSNLVAKGANPFK